MENTDTTMLKIIFNILLFSFFIGCFSSCEECYNELEIEEMEVVKTFNNKYANSYKSYDYLCKLGEIHVKSLTSEEVDSVAIVNLLKELTEIKGRGFLIRILDENSMHKYVEYSMVIEGTITYQSARDYEY